MIYLVWSYECIWPIEDYKNWWMGDCIQNLILLFWVLSDIIWAF